MSKSERIAYFINTQQATKHFMEVDRQTATVQSHSLFFRCIQLRAFFKFYNREYIYFFLCTSIVTVPVIMKFQTLQPLSTQTKVWYWTLLLTPYKQLILTN